jgi:hypothetical protein
MIAMTSIIRLAQKHWNSVESALLELLRESGGCPIDNREPKRPVEIWSSRSSSIGNAPKPGVNEKRESHSGQRI